MLQGKINPVLLSVVIMFGLTVASGVTFAQAEKKASAQAQTPAPAQSVPEQPKGPVFKFSLSDVMSKIKAQNAAEAKQSKEREVSFRKAMEEQERLFKETLAKRNAAEARSGTLSKQYDEDFNRIQDMKALLEQNQGNLGELFGVTRQIAGDASGVLSNSMINTQIKPVAGAEDRVDFLRRLAAAKELPNIVDLERMWYELMFEMNADSQVMKFTTPVIQADDSVKDTEIVRIGSFTAVGEGKYLSYLPSKKSLALLSRQPPQENLMSEARELQTTAITSGYIPAVVDPARGALLSLFVERPDVFERISKGEAVGYIIIAVGMLGALVAVFQYIYLFITKIAVNKQIQNLNKPIKNNPLGRMLIAVLGDGKRDTSKDLPELVELRISEAVLREIPKLERFQSFLRLAVAAGPLLGLIGTVIGMILTFQSITSSGSSDPKLMAQGIGQAMICTVLGLGTAIPLLFINSGLTALSRSVIHVLEEQSTQLLASRLLAGRK